MARERGVEVEPRAARSRDSRPSAREELESSEQRVSLRPAMSLDIPDEHVDAVGLLLTHGLEHRVRLADPGGGAEEHLQLLDLDALPPPSLGPGALRGLAGRCSRPQCSARGPPAFKVRSAQPESTFGPPRPAGSTTTTSRGGGQIRKASAASARSRDEGEPQPEWPIPYRSHHVGFTAPLPTAFNGTSGSRRRQTPRPPSKRRSTAVTLVRRRSLRESETVACHAMHCPRRNCGSRSVQRFTRA